MGAAKKTIALPPSEDPTRFKLLASAGDVFAERGFQATTVREICRRAGANVSAVNYYFRDKLGLYTEVLSESIASGQGEAMRQALAHSKTPEEALRKLIEGILSRLHDGGPSAWHFRIMAHEMAQPTPALARVIDQVMRSRYNQLREIIGQILHLPPDDETTRLCAHSVIGQLIHYVHGQPVIAILWPDLNLARPKDRQRVADHIADFTLRNLRALRKEKSR